MRKKQNIKSVLLTRVYTVISDIIGLVCQCAPPDISSNRLSVQINNVSLVQTH